MPRCGQLRRRLSHFTASRSLFGIRGILGIAAFVGISRPPWRSAANEGLSRAQSADAASSSTSASVVVRSRPNRSEDRASVSLRPRAISTCDGSADVEAQAAPGDTATSVSPSTRSRPVRPSNPTLRLCGSRGRSAPRRWTSGSAVSQSPPEPVPQRREPGSVCGAARPRQPRRLAEADDAGHVEGAGAQAAFVPAAALPRRRARPSTPAAPPARRRPSGRRSCARCTRAGRCPSRSCRCRRALRPARRRCGTRRPPRARGARCRQAAG